MIKKWVKETVKKRSSEEGMKRKRVREGGRREKRREGGKEAEYGHNPAPKLQRILE